MSERRDKGKKGGREGEGGEGGREGDDIHVHICMHVIAMSVYVHECIHDCTYSTHAQVRCLCAFVQSYVLVWKISL